MKKFYVFIAISSLVLAGCKIEDPIEEEMEPVIVNPLAYTYAMQDSVYRIIYDSNGVMVDTTYTTSANYAVRLEETSATSLNIYLYNTGDTLLGTIVDSSFVIPNQNGIEGGGYISTVDSTLFLNYESENGKWLHRAMSL